MPVAKYKDRREVTTEGYILSTLPILYVPLWKRDGSVFLSDDGHGFPCTVTGASRPTAIGRIFDGIDDKITGGNLGISSTDYNTILMWVKDTTASPPGFDGPIAIGTQVITASLYSNKLYTTRNTEDAAHTSMSSTHDWSVWHHLAMVYDGTQLYYRLFIDSVEETNAGNDYLSLPGSAVFSLGDNTGNSYWWDGLIGEAAVYKRALTLLEIQQHKLSTQWRYK